MRTIARGSACAATAVLLLGCGPADDQDRIADPEAVEQPAQEATSPLVITGEPREFPPAPEVPGGPLEPGLAVLVDELLEAAAAGPVRGEILEGIADAGDARVGWLLADILRVAAPGSPLVDGAVQAFEALTGVELGSASGVHWVVATDHLLAWDVPAWPGYRDAKARVFLQIEPAWAPFFDDADADIDWRLVSWGGVRIDDRPFGSSGRCPNGCIPSLDDPASTSAGGGDWYPDEGIVFGLVVGGEALALPRHQMEVHEMVNLTLGGRDLGIPYCTLCGAAQAYYTDDLPEGFDRAVLRTSGLLSRSNKVMYDLATHSAFDTFTGRAVSGPLRDAGVTLEQVTVVASTWAEWRRAHPETRIVARDGGISRNYPLTPLGGRDDDGPIFPVGTIDPRLPAQELVVGAIAPDGTPVAFPAVAAHAVLRDGGEVRQGEVSARLDGDGLRLSAGRRELASHQAYWFAWSQFHAGTEIWTPED